MFKRLRKGPHAAGPLRCSWESCHEIMLCVQPRRTVELGRSKVGQSSCLRDVGLSGSGCGVKTGSSAAGVVRFSTSTSITPPACSRECVKFIPTSAARGYPRFEAGPFPPSELPSPFYLYVPPRPLHRVCQSGECNLIENTARLTTLGLSKFALRALVAFVRRSLDSENARFDM